MTKQYRINMVLNQNGMYENGVKIELTDKVMEKYNNLRFWSKVGITAQSDLCWDWMAANKGKGYGGFYLNKKHMAASRAAYILYYKEDPKDKFVCHKCDNPSCCNPSHLFIGTAKENQEDMIKKGRKHSAFGERNANSILTTNDILDILELRNKKVRTRDIKKKYNISNTHVHRIFTGKRWGHLKSEMSI